MPSRHQVLLVSRSKEAAAELNNCLSDVRDLEVQTRIITSRQPDPLSGVAIFPDLMLLRISPDSGDELEALGRYTPDERPPLIVIGDGSDSKSMRAASRSRLRSA